MRKGKGRRICMVSLRGVNRHAAWCSNYEFEDVIRDVDDVDLISLSPGVLHEGRQWFARRLIWKPVLRQIRPLLNPGLDAVKVTSEYDLFVYICMNPADLIYLSAVKGWKERCAKSVCVMVEFYAGWLQEYKYHLSLLRDFDCVALAFSDSVEAVRSASERPCHHVPLGVDVLRFTPFPGVPERCVDVYSLGRRVGWVHEALLDRVSDRNVFYLHDTVPGVLVRPRDHREHRNLVANCAKRSKFFVVYPAKVDSSEETRGQSEVGARFFEGAAAGTVMIGHAPTVNAFARDFDWPDAVVDLGTSTQSLGAALAPFIELPHRLKELGQRNAVEAMRRFDWCYRWREVLRLVDMKPTESQTRRELALNDLAMRVEAGEFA